MSIHEKNFASWRKFISDEENDDWPKNISEVSQGSVNNILDFMADAEVGDLAFDGLFDDKMRIVLPLAFDPKSLSDSDLLQFTGVMKAVKKQGWTIDGESFAKGIAYKETQPPDFGPELNLKRYGKETPPGPKKKEMKIGRIINKSKQIAPEQKKWYSDNASRLIPQYTAIVSRYPIDILRMSDFKSIQSCHSEGGSYFKCAVAEAKGHGPVAFAVRTNKLNDFLEGKPIEYYDDQEIFKDSDRGIDGVIPVSRVRLRRFHNDQEDIDLAVPELRFYGNHVGDFMETVNHWALKNQFDKISDDIYIEDSELYTDPDWWRGYQEKIESLQRQISGFYNLSSPSIEEVNAKDAAEEAIDSVLEEFAKKVRRFEELLPDMDDFYLRGGSYKDSPAGRMLGSFFGLRKYAWNKELYRTQDRTLDFGIPEELQDIGKRKYRDLQDIAHHPDDRFLGEVDRIEAAIEEYNNNIDSLNNRLNNLHHIHAQASDLEHDLGYDIHELAEEERLFYYISGGISFEFDEDELTEKADDLAGDWSLQSTLARELSGDVMDEIEASISDYDIDFHTDLNFRIDFNNDDYHYGTTYNDADNFVDYLVELDQNYEELEDLVRTSLIEMGYLTATPFHEFKGKITKDDFEFNHFDLDVDNGAIFLTAKHNLGHSPMKAVEFIDPRAAKSERWVHPLGSSGDLMNPNRMHQSTVQMKRMIMKAINKDLSDAIDYAEKQLSLRGIETDQSELMAPLTDPGKLKLYIHTEPNEDPENPLMAYDVYLKIMCTLVRNDDPEKVLASVKFVEYLDAKLNKIAGDIAKVVGVHIRGAMMAKAASEKEAVNEGCRSKKRPRKIRIKLK